MTAVLVTGASSGLGLATSVRLARSGQQVLLACRSVARGAAAAATIRAQVPDARLDVIELDLASLASVRTAAALVADRTDVSLTALVCNAGIQVVTGIERSADGFELTFATNHLGHFLLAELLSPHLAEPGRIVFVSSGTHYGPLKSAGFPAPRWADPRVLADPESGHLDESGRSGRIRYATSKLANIYATHELARRLADRPVTVNAFDPGLMPETGLARDYSPAVQRWYARLTPLLIRLPGARSTARSADDLAWLATSPEVAGISGEYFVGR